ncbi:GSCFA domain-containing protein [Agrobacterium rosae]|uniref:GSCFA domain-containing protein n=1 Tax=Agrobacterium rosae TaxID=1972867 RepID=UPI002A16292B|nr:GSCFA domain-containing protein [Agrobacterium rosae]MDX8316902.1 GSCFA domain-containing protein [Agrobacterium rosae]MDX8316925.1 GSCFA domain-containing protein [Agrobacterium rosae]
MSNKFSDDGTFVEFKEEGHERRVGYSFFRGDTTNFYPALSSLRGKNGISKFVMKGWAPPQPFIDENTRIVAFGSCFAENISQYLNGLGFNILTKRPSNAYVSKMGDGFVHTDAIRGQFEWAWEGKNPSSHLWHGSSAEEYGYDDEVRTATKAIFDQADMFIVTLGLSEVWYDEETKEVFWRAVPKSHYDPERHKFRVVTFQETKDNLERIYSLIRKHRPEAKILFTISPIPLAATFRPVSAITASTASKAILKASFDEFYRGVDDENLHYFPSYEICRELFLHPYGADGRHVMPYILDLNMNVFERYYCTTGKTDEDISAKYADARGKDSIVASSGFQTGRDF